MGAKAVVSERCFGLSILTPDGLFVAFHWLQTPVGFALPLNGLMRLSVYLRESMEVACVLRISRTNLLLSKKISLTKWMQMERIECWTKALKLLNLSALSKADPNRFNADRRSHHSVSLTFQDHINDPTPLHALAETSALEAQPHCLR